VLRQNTKRLFQTLIRSVLLYGSETWVLTKSEENQLLVFGVYRRRYNHELDKEFDSQKCHEDKQIALHWSHDQKTRRPTTKNSIQGQTQWKEKSRKTEIQVNGWGEQR
jgi:hypothetical protein